MKKLQTGDPIIIISGKYKGKVSSIETLGEDKVWVKGINEMKKAVKGKGFIKKHLPLHISNVMYYLESEKKPTKIAIEITKEGKRVRKSKVTNSILK